MQTNLTHLNADGICHVSQKMLFVIDLSTKMSGIALFKKKLSNKKKKNNTVWKQTKKLVLVVE